MIIALHIFNSSICTLNYKIYMVLFTSIRLFLCNSIQTVHKRSTLRFLCYQFKDFAKPRKFICSTVCFQRRDCIVDVSRQNLNFLIPTLIYTVIPLVVSRDSFFRAARTSSLIISFFYSSLQNFNHYQERPLQFFRLSL